MTSSGDSSVERNDRSLVTIAHRAANDAATLRAAVDAGVDLIEADVRFFKGVPEVRHTKTLGPRLLWEPGELVHRHGSVVPTLADLLDSLGDESRRLLLDLKGLRPGLPPVVATVLREHVPDTPITASTPHWWMFKAFADVPQVRTVPSAGSWPMVERLRRLVRRGHGTWPDGRRIYGCSAHRTLLTPEIVDELCRHVEHVFTWPVDSPAELAAAQELGVTGVASKEISLLETLLGSR